MVDQLSSFAAEVTRVAKEVGTEGKLGGQAEVRGVSGTWKGLTENVNQLAGTLTTQLRAMSDVATAVTQGDLSRSITVEAQGEVADLKDNVNQMIANRFALGEGLVGQAALEKKTILITGAPADYIKVTSGLGEAAPVNLIVMPVLFEDQVLAVIELGSLRPFSDINQAFLDQLMET